MTQGLLEAITSAVGEELTLLSGLRSTRLTAPFQPETRISSGVNSASSVDAGITITLGSGTYGSAVAGQRLRITSGSYAGRSALIQSVSPTSATLVAPGLSVNLTNVSWEVVRDADTTMSVENAIDWPTDGEVYIEGQRYLYSSRTDTSLIGVTYTNRQRARGRITCVAGASIAEGETVTINDGYGNTQVFEFDTDSIVVAGRIRVQITGAFTANQVRDALAAAIESAGFNLLVASPEDATIDLFCLTEGTQGNVSMSDTVANAGFIVEGMTGGTLFSSGAAVLHNTLAEVVDYTQSYSSRDQFRRALLLDYATSEDLSVISRNLGLDRPAGLVDDDTWREIVKLVAYGYRGTRRLIEAVLNQVVGLGEWDLLEDTTGNYSIDPRTDLAVFPDSISNNPATVFLRRNGQEETSVGKTFLDGYETRPIASTTSIVATQEPERLASIRLARDPLPERLIAFGTSAVGTNNGTTVTAPVNSFPAPRIQPGDVFVLTSGPYSGRRGTIQSVSTPTTVLTLNNPSSMGSFGYAIGTNFSAASWKIVRPVSSFRTQLPSTEQYIEYVGDTGTTIWEFVGTGGITEIGSTSIVTATAANGAYFQMTVAAAQTAAYRHRLRVQPHSACYFDIVARAQGTPSVSATGGLQWCVQLRDGARNICVGLVNGVFCFVNASTGAQIGTGLAYSNINDWQTIRVEKSGGLVESTRRVRLFIGGVLRDDVAYTAFSASSDTELRFGLQNAAIDTVDFQIKQIDWSTQTNRDYNSTHVATGSLTGGASRNIVDTGTNNLFQPSDAGLRSVRIHDWTVANAGGGNPRGEWAIETYVNANTVTLTGAQKRGGRTFGTQFPNRFTVRGDSAAFIFPDHRGHNIIIENGPNAGTYAITGLLDPETFASITASLPLTSALSMTNLVNVPFRVQTNAITVSPNFPFPADDTEVNWRISPVFAADAGPFPYEIVDTSSVSGTSVTLRQALPIGLVGGYVPLVELEYTTVLSGQISDELDSNSYTVPNYQMYPFYLNDQWGYLRDLIDAITAAGVIVDYDSLVRDAAGLHLLQ